MIDEMGIEKMREFTKSITLNERIYKIVITKIK